MNTVSALPGIMLCRLLMCSWVTPLSVHTLSMKRATNLTTELATSLFSESSNPLSVSKLSATLPAMLQNTHDDKMKMRKVNPQYPGGDLIWELRFVCWQICIWGCTVIKSAESESDMQPGMSKVLMPASIAQTQSARIHVSHRDGDAIPPLQSQSECDQIQMSSVRNKQVRGKNERKFPQTQILGCSRIKWKHCVLADFWGIQCEIWNKQFNEAQLLLITNI